MAAWVCTECTTAYSVGAPCCPHCRATDYREQGADMPKITRLGGPTIAGASVVAGGWGNEGDPDVWPEPEQADEAVEEGGEEPSAGSSSETSPEKPSSEPGKKPSSRRKPARTTGSPSTQDRTGNSSVRSTDGGQEDGTSETDSAADGGGAAN